MVCVGNQQIRLLLRTALVVHPKMSYNEGAGKCKILPNATGLTDDEGLGDLGSHKGQKLA